MRSSRPLLVTGDPLCPRHLPVSKTIPRLEVRTAGVGVDYDVALLHVVEKPFRVLRRKINAPVTDVAVALLGDRPRRGMYELPAVRYTGCPLHLGDVPAGIEREAERGGVHHFRRVPV